MTSFYKILVSKPASILNTFAKFINFANVFKLLLQRGKKSGKMLLGNGETGEIPVRARHRNCKFNFGLSFAAKKRKAIEALL